MTLRNWLTERRHHRHAVVLGVAAFAIAGVTAASTAVADEPGVSTTQVISWTNSFRKVQNQGVVNVAVLPASSAVSVWTTASATAVACLGCRSTAIDAHVVIVGGRSQFLQANNRAVAENRRCVGCTSVALSYQIVAIAPRPVALTAAGKSRLAALSAAMQSLASTGAPATMADQADAIVERVLATLIADVVPLAQPATAARTLSATVAPALSVRVFRQFRIAH